MHDIFAGVCYYNMCHIINYYTGRLKILTLDTLNFRETSRKIICLTLAKKYTFKFAHFLLNHENNEEFIIFDKYKINSDVEFLFNILNMSSENLVSYSKVDFKVSIYKIGNYFTHFTHTTYLSISNT